MRILYADTGLRSLEGHHASSGAALPAAFRQIGHEVVVLGYDRLLPELQQATGAQPFFRHFTYGGASTDPISGWLTNFVTASEVTKEDLRRAWSKLGPFDLIYFNSIRPAQIAALGLWMKGAFKDAADAPAVAIELGTEAGLARSNGPAGATFTVRDPVASLYRHAVERTGADWVRRMTFLTVTEAAAEEYAFILQAPAHVVPMPQPLPPLRRRVARDRLTIGLLGHQRADKGWQFAPDFIPLVLSRHPEVTFVAHQSDPQMQPEANKRMQGLAASDPRVELIIQPAVHGAWFDLIDRCDIIALPYDPVRYESAYSAIVGEALAAGAPIVVPAATTMSAAVDAAGGPGTTFTSWDAPAIAGAIGEAVDRFADLAERAHRAGAAWHEHHGPDRFVAKVIEVSEAKPRRKRFFGLWR